MTELPMVTEENYKEFTGTYTVSVDLGYGSRTDKFTIDKVDVIGLTKAHALIVIDNAADEAIGEMLDTNYWREDD